MLKILHTAYKNNKNKTVYFLGLPHCYRTPCPSFFSFYSCTVRFPQSVASNQHSCLFHPPPCLQHSDEGLGHLLQKIKNREAKIYEQYPKTNLCSSQNRPASSWLQIPSEQAMSEPSRDPVSLPSILEE